MVEAIGFAIMWMYATSILLPNGDWNAPKYGGKNKLLSSLASTLFVFLHLIFGCFRLGTISLPLLLSSLILHGCPPSWLLTFSKCTI